MIQLYGAKRYIKVACLLRWVAMMNKFGKSLFKGDFFNSI